LEERFVIHSSHNRIEQQRRWCAIRNSVVKRKAQHAGVTNSQLAVAHHGALGDSPDAKNGRLWTVKNRSEGVDAVNAKIADRRRTTCEVRGL
jgi:hypothetical protein